MSCRSSLRMFTLALVVLFGLAMPALAQEGDDLGVCVPPMARLADQMGRSCEDLLAYQAQGIGLGQIKMAWRLSQSLPGYAGDWRDLLEAHQAGQGWGEVMMAYRMAAAYEADPQVMLAYKQSGLGWGQIRQAQSLVDAGMAASFEDALMLLQDGRDWDEIRAEQGLSEGPPPWAGRPASKGLPPGHTKPGRDTPDR